MSGSIIENYDEAVDAMHSAGFSFLANYLVPIIENYHSLDNESRNNLEKKHFIEKAFKEQNGFSDSSKDNTRNRVNAAIRLIRSGYVEATLDTIIASEHHLVTKPVKDKAIEIYELIESGELKLPIEYQH